MPIAGGYLPNAGASYNELNAVTRRAFIPSLVVQQATATPLLSAMLSNAQTASGGVSSVTVPVQGVPMTTAQATGYDGSFAQPSVVNAVGSAEFNLKCIIVPIPFLGMEGLAQMNAAVIPLVEARMNDAGNTLSDFISTQLWTNATNATINIDGLPLQVGTGTYGNIDGATSTWWQGQTRSAASSNPTRQNILELIVSAMSFNGGQMPTGVFMHPRNWVLLAEDFVGQEQYRITPQDAFIDSTGGAKSAFTALSVAGVPVFMDPYASPGDVYALNSQYQSFYIHEAAAFAFTGWMSTLSNFSLGYIGAVVVVLENIITKRKAITLQQGFTSAAA